MKNVSKLVVKMGLISLLSVVPLAAQIDNGVRFTTSFPFYVGNAKMPAGSYKITQSDMDESILQIQTTMACIRRSLSSYPCIRRNLILTPMSPSTNTEIQST